MTRVVVGIDGASPAGTALARAAMEARLRDAVLDVIAAWTYPPLSVEEKRVTTARQVEDDTRSSAAAQLDTILGDPSFGNLAVSLTVEMGAPAKVLLSSAEGSDLLVVGRRDHARFRHLVMGSVADQCIRHSPCPTLVVPHRDDQRGDENGPIVVGLDGSATAGRGLTWAVDEAARLGCAVRAVHSWQQPYVLTPDSAAAILDPAALDAQARRDLDSWIAAADVPDGVELSGVVAPGDPATALLDEAESASLLVVGSRGRGGFVGLLLGSVGRRVAHLSPCPVVVVPHDGAGRHVSPDPQRE